MTPDEGGRFIAYVAKCKLCGFEDPDPRVVAEHVENHTEEDRDAMGASA